MSLRQSRLFLCRLLCSCGMETIRNRDIRIARNRRGDFEDARRRLDGMRKSHGHDIAAAIFGFIEALIGAFEQLDGG